MIRLDRALSAWGTPEFASVLKSELRQLTVEQLPLQQALTMSSYAVNGNIDFMLLSSSEEQTHLRVKLGIFFAGVIAGCSCADDPTPVDENDEYCEVELTIDKTTADATITLR